MEHVIADPMDPCATVDEVHNFLAISFAEPLLAMIQNRPKETRTDSTSMGKGCTN